jgi:hypothetical protein
MGAFQTQAQIVTGLMEQRKERELKSGKYVEIYYAFDPRPRCEYGKYLRRIQEIVG